MKITEEKIRKAAMQVANKSGLDDQWKKWLIKQITAEILQEANREEVIRIKVADIPDDEFAKFMLTQ